MIKLEIQKNANLRRDSAIGEAEHGADLLPPSEMILDTLYAKISC